MRERERERGRKREIFHQHEQTFMFCRPENGIPSNKNLEIDFQQDNEFLGVGIVLCSSKAKFQVIISNTLSEPPGLHFVEL